MATPPSKENTARSGRSGSSARSGSKEAMPNSTAGNGPAPGGGMFKKLFLRIGEKVGSVQKTEYSPQFLDACREMEKYRVVVEDLSLNVLRVAQQNPRYIPTPLAKMNIDPPPGQAPFEELSGTISKIQPLLDEKFTLSKHNEATAKVAKLHRDFQDKVRKSLHHLRTFINVEYVDYEVARKELDESRQEMDFAKHELKNAKNAEQIQAKNLLYERASKKFELQLQKTTAVLEKFPTIRDLHYKDLLTFCHLERKYHEDCAKVLKL